MRQAILQIGDYTATMDPETDEFVCAPANPPLQLRLNLYLRSIKGQYRPDRFAHWVESTAKQFDGKIVRLDRLNPSEADEPGRVY